MIEILTGIGAGITYSLSSWLKKKDQDFEWLKFSTTVVIGGVVGVVMFFANMPIDVAYTYAVGLGAVPLVENIIKIVARKVFGMDW